MCLVGSEVQCNLGKSKIWQLMILAMMCSLIIAAIYPVCGSVNEYIEWRHLNPGHYLAQCMNTTFVILAVSHFIAFWIGEEVAHAKEDMEGGKDEAESHENDT